MENKYCYFMGNKYLLTIEIDEQATKPVVRKESNQMIYTGKQCTETLLANALKSFYIKEARKSIKQRLTLYQPQIKVKYKSFTIESHVNKWGTCNANRELTFDWRLMLFPIGAIDYVVVHEMCHLIHLNHDRSFWRLVGKLCPNYKEIMPLLGTSKTRDL